MVFTQTDAIIAAFVAGVFLVAIVVLISLKLTDTTTRRPERNKSLRKRAKEDTAYLMQNYYNSASQILRETAKHRFDNSDNRY